MQAVGVDRQRDVEAVVDRQRHAERRQRRLQRPRLFDEGARRRVLLPQLHHGRAAAHGRQRDVDDAAARRQPAVGDQAQPQAGDVERHSARPHARRDVRRRDGVERVDEGDAETARAASAVSAAFSPATP